MDGEDLEALKDSDCSTLDVRCTNVEKHTMDAKQINSRLDGQRKPNLEVIS